MEYLTKESQGASFYAQDKIPKMFSLLSLRARDGTGLRAQGSGCLLEQRALYLLGAP